MLFSSPELAEEDFELLLGVEPSAEVLVEVMFPKGGTIDEESHAVGVELEDVDFEVDIPPVEPVDGALDKEFVRLRVMLVTL